MDQRKKRRNNVLVYSRMVISAVEKGVPLNDIMMETARFHGRQFTNEVLKRVIEML